MANYWTARLKVKLPHIHLVQDFRDPWNDHFCAPDNSHFWFSWQKKISLACERYALAHADVVVTVTDSLGELYKQKVECEADFVTIPNGYDPDRYKNLIFRPDSKKMRLVYIGNLFVGRDQALRILLDSILELADQNQEFGSTFELVTYGGFPLGLHRETHDLEERGLLHVHGYVSPEEAIQIAGNAFALLLVNAARFPYLVSGKVYEYIALNRPIYALTPEGELTNLVRQGNLGVIAPISDPAEQKRGLTKLFEIWRNNPNYIPVINKHFSTQFQYPNLVSRLVTHFK
jgi:glycosyltransferase involved in cell wall biosynthesis